LARRENRGRKEGKNCYGNREEDSGEQRERERERDLRASNIESDRRSGVASPSIVAASDYGERASERASERETDDERGTTNRDEPVRAFDSPTIEPRERKSTRRVCEERRERDDAHTLLG